MPNIRYLSIKIAAKQQIVKLISQKKEKIFSNGKVGIMENELKNSVRSPSLEKLERLEGFLQSRIMGQDKILTPLCRCLKYGWFNLNTPGRPRGTLFLLGPTGVGKTESIRSAVEFMYGSDDKNFLRLDMSEFSRQAGEEALTNLIGTPGSTTGGRMGAFLEQCSEGVILYDEIEKSHPAIFTILLQQLDAARITLSSNKTYDLSRFFIVATSNIGAQIFQHMKHLSEQRLRKNLEMQLKNRFSPEFVARFGKFGQEILIFRPLEPDHLRLIARKFYLLLLPQYKTHGMNIDGFTPAVVEETLRSIDNTRNGARELRSCIERKIREFVFNTIRLQLPRSGILDVCPEAPELLRLIKSDEAQEVISCQS